MEYEPSVKLYESEDPYRDTFITSLSAQDPIPDLSVYVGKKKFCSAVINGTWIFYEGKHFNAGYDAHVQPYYGTHGRVVKFQGHFSSARCVGSSQNIVKDTITLFSKHNYEGHEQLVNEREADVTGSSFIITGNEAWTVYSEPNYQGTSNSYIPHQTPNHEPGVIQNFGDYQIRSVRKGQYSVRAPIALPSFPA